MSKYLLYISTIFVLAPLFSIGQDSINIKVESIDRYVSAVNSTLNKYKKEHRKCCDCFGTDTYFKDSANIIKIHNYQSCFNIDYYFENNELKLVTIDGSFRRNCGGTEARYCWDTAVVRDYKSKIYYDQQAVIKNIEVGTKPCCKIAPCGDYEDSIAFNSKAKVFINTILKVKNKITLDTIVEYEIHDLEGNDILKGVGKKINVSKLMFNKLYYLRTGQSRYTTRQIYIIREKK